MPSHSQLYVHSAFDLSFQDLILSQTFIFHSISTIVRQGKYKDAGDKKAGLTICPIGIPCNDYQPLPYLMLHLELGNGSNYQESKSKIWAISFICEMNTTYPGLVDKWVAAWDKLQTETVSLEETAALSKKKKSKEKKSKKMIPQQQEELNQKHQAVDYYNHYSVFVHGTSLDTYGILKIMGIEKEFATLLQITMPSPDKEE
jgi:hypothetical protein